MTDFTLPNGMRTDSVNIHKFAKDLSKNTKDIEYRIACIRDFVRENPGKVLTVEMIAKAAQYSAAPSATHVLKKLLKEGRLTRTRIKAGKGKSYIYTWHDKREKDPIRTHGPVNIIPGFQPDTTVENIFLKDFDEKAWKFITDQHVTEIDQILKFRDWISENTKGETE